MAYTAPEGYFTEAAKQSRYDTGVSTVDSGTPEFQDYSADSTDAEFLERVYNNETGRASDPDGLSYWQGQLDAGHSREDIIAGFNVSQEGQGYDNPTPPSADSLIDPVSTGQDKVSKSVYVGPAETATAERDAQSTYDASGREIDPNDLMGERMRLLTQSDSPMMQRAKQEGMLLAARRGLSNSSIAAGNAMGAMVDRAAPIAQQESQAYLQQGMANQGYLNEAAKQNAQTSASFQAQNAQNTTETNRYNVGVEQQVEMKYSDDLNKALSEDLRALNERALQTLKGSQSVDLLSLEADYKNLLQTNLSAAELSKSYIAGVTDLINDPKMSAESIAKGVELLQGGINSGLDVIEGISGIDLSTYSFGDTTADTTTVDPAVIEASNTGSFGGRLSF